VRVVVQRVKEAQVKVAEEVVGKIGQGLLVFLAVGKEDTQADIDYLVEKICHLRIFPDAESKFNRSLEEVKGALLVVSQFTLWGDCRKGRRPSFTESASPAMAEPLYNRFIEKAKDKGIPVASGRFQETMEVCLINDGPVTLLLDSKKYF
jgi:D-tyrosyl-tRNA(Tyr) deacylase